MKNETLLKEILEKEVDISNKIYQKDFEDLTYKVNWDILGVKGFQIYEQDNYTYKIGEIFEDPDVSLTFLAAEFRLYLVELKTRK
jgi:hypothetical protein